MVKRLEQPPKWTDRQVIFATALESGATVKDAADAVGVSERYAYDILGKEEAAITQLRELVKPVVRVNIREIRAIARDKAEAEFEARLGKAFGALDDAFESGDPKTALEAAKESFNRIFGKATAKLEVSGGLKHTHTLQLTPAQAQAFALDAENDLAFHSRANQLTAGTPPLTAVIDVTSD